MVSVLLIDDDAELSKLWKSITDEQLELDAAHDGPSGLEKALNNPYAVVILDVMLPGMSGLDVRSSSARKARYRC